MKKEEAIKFYKEQHKPICNITKDSKLIYFIEKMIKRANKEHKKNGTAEPVTLFVSKKQTGEFNLTFCPMGQIDKQGYFNFIRLVELNTDWEYMISIQEGWCLTGFDFTEVVKEYGRIGNHPEAYDVLNINVKTKAEILVGKAIVDGKKIFPVDWHKQEELVDCNFTSFSSNS